MRFIVRSSVDLPQPRADERGDATLGDVEVDVLQPPEPAVEKSSFAIEFSARRAQPCECTSGRATIVSVFIAFP